MAASLEFLDRDRRMDTSSHPRGSPCQALRLEESGTARGPVQKPRAGRIDSYLVLHRIWYQIEAKVKWPSKLGDGGLKYALTYIDRALDAAEEQLESPTEEYWGDRGLALCYVVPELNWSAKHPTPPKSTFLDELLWRLGSRPLLASYKPPRGQKPWTAEPRRRHYPGFLLVGRVSW